jgi:glutamine amidotransferase
MTRVVIIDTGIANTASVASSFGRLGLEPRFTRDARVVQDARLVVLPGVGSFSAGMSSLRRTGLDRVVQDRCEAGLPLLAICLGLQLMCSGSDESPAVRGLGVINTRVTRFNAGIRTPQYGWNQVTPKEGLKIKPGYAYYSNSYRIEEIPDGWLGALSDHGGSFVAALQRGPIMACQFHPELSGEWGRLLLQCWIDSTKEAATC